MSQETKTTNRCELHSWQNAFPVDNTCPYCPQPTKGGAAKTAQLHSDPQGHIQPVKKLTANQAKQEALDLWTSRNISPNLAFLLIGWLDADARREIANGGKVTVAESLTEFVTVHRTMVEALPMR